MDLPTRLDLFATGRDYVIKHAKKIDPYQVDVLGSDVNIFVGVASVMAYSIVMHLAYSVSRLLLDGAEDEDLDRYAFDRYSLIRKAASAAVGNVRVYRDVAGTTGSIPIGTKLLTITGVEYITTSVITFGVSDLSRTGTVRAVQAGKATQVGANTIRRFSNTSALFDSSLKVNNDDRTAGGEDKEENETFRERIRDFWRTARRGTLSAIEFGARQVPGVVSAQAVEALTEGNRPARVVNLYIADSSGVANQVLANIVRTQLNEYRAAGITVLVYPSLPQIVGVILKLTFTANVDTQTLTDTVRAAIVEFINSLPVNGTLLKADLYSVLRRFTSNGLIVTEDTIVAPTGDLIPNVGSTLRTTITNVTIQ